MTSPASEPKLLLFPINPLNLRYLVTKTEKKKNLRKVAMMLVVDKAKQTW